jgi:hypothetical protein
MTSETLEIVTRVSDLIRRSKAKNAIECIENIMRRDGYIDTIYEQAYNKLITYISVNVTIRKVDELSYQIFCNRKKH